MTVQMREGMPVIQNQVGEFFGIKWLSMSNWHYYTPDATFPTFPLTRALPPLPQFPPPHSFDDGIEKAQLSDRPSQAKNREE